MIQDTAGLFWLYGTHNTLASAPDMATVSAVSAGDISPDFSKLKRESGAGAYHARHWMTE
ncbi:MAG TPA: hypothetical protein VGG63_00915 [Steroidobacteraceae bacterium]|jgi:hypothetical protein